MPDTPTFGRYAELSYEQMRSEQQSRKGLQDRAVKALGHICHAPAGNPVGANLET